MYIITRNDLSNPQKAVQATHAAIEATREFLTKEDEHPSVIILIVKGENKLKRSLDELSKSLKYKCFYEPDRNNEMTAIAFEPIASDDERRELFSRYQLMY